MRHSSSTRPRRISPWAVVATLAVGGLSVGLGVAVANDTADTDAAEPAIELTGEINEMGMPVMETPGTATGDAVAGPIEVTGAEWSLGQVPLDTAVRPTWVLRNTGTETVTVGEPHPEVVEGCCPGPFTIDASTIAPGEDVTLSFELSMHPGMDGWHEIDVHVPVRTSVGEQLLTVGVTGDFRDA